MSDDFLNGFILGLWCALVLKWIGDWWRRRYKIIRRDKEVSDGTQTSSGDSPRGAP